MEPTTFNYFCKLIWDISMKIHQYINNNMSINEKKNLELNPGIKTLFLYFFVIIKYDHFFVDELKFFVLLENYPHNCRTNYNSIDSLCLARTKELQKLILFFFFYFILLHLFKSSPGITLNTILQEYKNIEKCILYIVFQGYS